MSSIVRFHKITLLLSAVFSIIFIILLSLAIYFYPGGTRFDHTTIGFTFLKNFISDLGQTIALNGELNTISRVLFTTAILLFSIIQIVFTLNIPIILEKNKISFAFSLIALLAGVVSAGLYIGIAFNPHDVNPSMHNKLIYTAAPLFFISSLFLTIALFLSKTTKRFLAYTVLSIIVVFFIFAIITWIGTNLESGIKWSIRILGHTILTFFETIVYGILAIGFYNHIIKSEDIKSHDIEEPIKVSHTKI